MKSRYFFFILVFFLLLLVNCSSVVHKDPHTGYYSVSGRVIDAGGEGLGEVTLCFGKDYGTAITDDDGSWLKSGLKGKVLITPSKEGILAFDPEEVKVEGKQEDVNFQVLLTVEQFEEMKETTIIVNTKVTERYDPNNRESSLAYLAEEIRNLPGIGKAISNKEGLFVKFEKGGVIAWQSDTFSPVSADVDAYQSLKELKNRINIYPQKILGNNRAVIINSLADDVSFDNQKSLDEMESFLDRAGYHVDRKNGLDVDITFFKELDTYGFIFMVGHGALIRAHEGFWPSTEVIAFQTGQEPIFTEKWFALYSMDWLKGRTIIMKDVGWGNIMDDEVFPPKKEEKRDFIAITNRFIEHYTSNYEDALVISFSCSGLKEDFMARAFIENGAQAYLGWTEITCGVFLAGKVDLVEYLALGLNLAEALEKLDPGQKGGFIENIGIKTKVKYYPEEAAEARLIKMPIYTLTISIEGEGRTIPAEGFHDYNHGTSVELSAYPTEGWHFRKWIGHVADKESVETTVFMDEDKRVNALFEQSIRDFDGGSGTKEDPYQVADAMQLDNVRNYLDRYFLQTKDIDLSGFREGAGWEPIGKDYHNPFTGFYDGNNYKIDNLTINRPEAIYVGLFGVSYGSLIENLSLKNVDIIGGGRVAGVAGGGSVTITNSYVEGNILGKNQVGGLVGLNSGAVIDSHTNVIIESDSTAGGLIASNLGVIRASYAIGSVTGSWVGGLVGSNSGEIQRSYAKGDVLGKGENTGGLVGINFGSITASYATGSVTGEKSFVGGLVGKNDGAHNEDGIIMNSYAIGSVTGHDLVGGFVGSNYFGDIENSYATGDVTGNRYVGGLVGRNEQYAWDNKESIITNSYASGRVRGNFLTGGLVGWNDGRIFNCYYDRDTTQQEDTGKGIPKTTLEMTQQSTFEPEWDFDYLWGIDEGNSYPYLQWQILETYPYP